MNKTLGLILLTIGIGITAAFGSSLSPAFKSEMITKGEASFAATRVSKKHKAYCKARKKAGMKAAENCKNRKGRTVHLVKPSRLEGRSPLRQNKKILNALKKRSERMPPEVSKARRLWVKSLKRERTALKAAAAVGTQGPGARLRGWAGLSGAGFGLGLLLVIAGSWICRVAIGRELVEGTDDAEAGPVDFGELLKDVLQRTRTLHSDMAAIEAPTQADLETLKARLEDIQKGDLARICDAGPRVQQRYGMKGFAEIFSPLSAAERKLNRMWAALVDQHWPEALASVALAQANLEAAVEAAMVQSKPAANT